MAKFRDYVTAGGLMSYAPDFSEAFRLAARYVDKILKGAKPRDLPIEQPTVFELVINLKAAKSLGVTRKVTAQVAHDRQVVAHRLAMTLTIEDSGSHTEITDVA